MEELVENTLDEMQAAAGGRGSQIGTCLDFKLNTGSPRVARAQIGKEDKFLKVLGKKISRSSLRVKDSLQHGASEALHPLGTYFLKPRIALTALAGIYDQRELFRESVYRCSGEDLRALDGIIRRQFFTRDALCHVVEEAAIRGVMSQSPGNPPANGPLVAAHHLLAFSLEHGPMQTDKFGATTNTLFNTLNNLFSDTDMPTKDRLFSCY
jgi:hypothetical protein